VGEARPGHHGCVDVMALTSLSHLTLGSKLNWATWVLWRNGCVWNCTSFVHRYRYIHLNNRTWFCVMLNGTFSEWFISLVLVLTTVSRVPSSLQLDITAAIVNKSVRNW